MKAKRNVFTILCNQGLVSKRSLVLELIHPSEAFCPTKQARVQAGFNTDQWKRKIVLLTKDIRSGMLVSKRKPLPLDNKWEGLPSRNGVLSTNQ